MINEVINNIYMAYSVNDVVIIINMKSVGVFVYGDLGRSPRMQNHAI